MTHLERIGLEAVFDQPDLLDADPLLEWMRACGVDMSAGAVALFRHQDTALTPASGFERPEMTPAARLSAAIEVIADDKRVEKKDRNVNEPVQFLLSRATQPYELVVNDIKKDMIVGYVAAPKVQQTQAQASQ